MHNTMTTKYTGNAQTPESIIQIWYI